MPRIYLEKQLRCGTHPAVLKVKYQLLVHPRAGFPDEPNSPALELPHEHPAIRDFPGTVTGLLLVYRAYRASRGKLLDNE